MYGAPGVSASAEGTAATTFRDPGRAMPGPWLPIGCGRWSVRLPRDVLCEAVRIVAREVQSIPQFPGDGAGGESAGEERVSQGACRTFVGRGGGVRVRRDHHHDLSLDLAIA